MSKQYSIALSYSRPVTPYRLLEYIKFNGAEYLDTVDPAQNKFYYANFTVPAGQNQSAPFAIMYTFKGRTAASTDYSIRAELSMYYSSAKYRAWSDINNYDPDYIDYANVLDSSHSYQARWRTYGNNYTHWLCIRDTTTSTDHGKYYDNSSHYTVPLSQMRKIKLMMRTNTSGSSTVYTKGNIYRFFRRNGDDSATIDLDMYPCQRKSDGVCGLYDVISQTFYPMEGTSITTNAAGPTVKENWNGQAPA